MQQRLSQFFATLDLECEIAEEPVEEGLPPFLEQIFQGERNFWTAAENLQNLKGKYTSDEELINKVAQLLNKEPRHFLVLAHLHRQLRFTNVELTHFLFDRHRLNDLAYFYHLLNTDNTFKKQFEKVIKSTNWVKYVGSLDAEKPEKDALLASFKKTLTSYFGSEKSCWSLWQARIENDPTVSYRIAEFLIKKEDLKKLIETNSVINALKRSLRTVNVEILKRERGEYGARRVKEILESNGFVYEPYSQFKDIEDLENFLKTQSFLTKPNEYVYTTEKLWRREDKRFDFVLIFKDKVKFVIETNYFTTSMSKIREVVRHFMELKKACRGKYKLIYITDGMGWFGLAKDVKRMLEFEIEEQKKEPSQVQFLMNLEIFRQNTDLIKNEMRR
ncbi:MAG: DpnII family type II restriction endonuclease [Candidatus Bathyarchaeia archaeon]